MTAALSPVLLCAVAPASPATAQSLLSIDDSFNVARRFAADRVEHPEIRLPTVETVAGQRMLFDLRYKQIDERDLHIDVFLPPKGTSNGQGLLLVHGGAWRSGNKSHSYPLANLLAQRGYAVFMPEFRLAPEAPYPAGLADVTDAIAWAKGRATEFGVSPDRIAIGGDSSGGQMAALLAYSASTRVSALIDLDGVLDMTDPLALTFENAAGASSPFARWIGGAFETAGPRWREASAASHVGPQSPPTLILGSGSPRFTAGRQSVMATLDRHHIRNRFVAFDRAPHTFWLYEPYLPRVVDQIDRFLRNRP
ncbi:alpha/beta hydrolase [Sphingomonas sp. RS2018]